MERSLRTKAPASSGERMSGLVTISIKHTPARLRSMNDRLGSWSCMDLPASCSMCRRSTPMSRVVPSARSTVTMPSPTTGCRYWEI